jgi:Ca2+:H+ antiporter
VLVGIAVLFAASAVARYVTAIPRLAAFIAAAVALAGLAWTVSFCTEQVGMRFGSATTGTLQATVGNLPEFFVVIFALQARETIVAQSAIIGAILVNALLVLGLVLIVGSLRSADGIMRFSPRLPNDTATLLLVASITIVLIALVTGAHDAASAHVGTISVVGAAGMLIVYGIWMRQYLSSQSKMADPDDFGDSAGPRVPIRTSLILLVSAGIGSAFVSDWFVSALKPTIQTVHITQTFAGLVIVAIAGNAVENAAGVYLAFRGRSELAISVVKGSVAQLAAFLFPLLVIVSLFTASRLTFSMQSVLAGALIGTALLIWQITGDGEATPFEGAALIALYVVLATVAAFEH